MTNLADIADIVPIQVWDGVVARRVQGEQLTLAVVELAPDAVVPSHVHANEQCGLVIEGEVTFRIGDALVDATLHWSGGIDDVALYAGALTPDQVAALPSQA